ncbi:MAG: acylaminoacyl-peptidase [Acidimicrobiia bacterium]|jgi:dipeptidyl aminopeptidase/acylaminoacyl peptidase
MRVKLTRSALCAGVVVLGWMLAMPVASLEAQAPQKRAIGYDTMDYWRSIGGTRVSDDGQWLAYATSSQAEDGELIVRNLASGKEFRHPRGSAPNFTPDAKFVVFTILPPKSNGDDDDAPEGGASQGGESAGGNNNAANRNAAGIMSLENGQVTTIEQVSTIRLAPESSTWVAFHKARAGAAGGRGGRGGAGGGAGRGGGAAAAEAGQAASGGNAQGRGNTPPAKRKDVGAELIVRNLATGQDVTIAEVSEFAWGKGGAWLAYGVSSNDAAKDGAFARQMSDGATRTLHTGKGNYKQFAFDEAGAQLAFLSDQAEYEKPVSPYRLYFWKAGEQAAAELVSGATRGMPAGMVVHDSALRFSEDGSQLYLNTAPPPPPPADPNAKRPINVDVWNYLDGQLQPMQRVRATQERNRSYRAVWHVGDKRFVQLATPDMPSVNPGTNTARAIGSSDLPYQQFVSWDQGYNDVFLVDLKNGQRRKVLERTSQVPSLSPGGGYLTWFDEFAGHWFSYRISDGLKVNLTERLPVKFSQEDHDTPDQPGSYGLAGWTDNDRTIWLYDQFDIWEVRPDGTNARMITGGEGRTQQVVFRYRNLDSEQRTIPTSGPVLLSATDDRTKATGFYRVTSGSAPQKVVMLDKAFGAVTKAKNADRLVFTLSRFEEFPNLWVSDGNFGNMQKVSDANPQQAEYNWGTSEIVEYINADGIKLRAILTKPENFDPTKKYPMMVYIYEQLSQGLHGYSAPNVGTSVNVTRYVSNGYVVLRPDIIYSTGFPGEAAEKCVIPAVNTIVAEGYIDPKRIGIQGHSWGGYQITHLITRTNMFAAVQAGASVSNMVSAYGGIRWGTGMVRQFQYEKTQSRIGAPPWDKTLEFIENSPIFWVEKVQTPYLSIHNDADDAVPWYQGIEFFVAMRRLGKEAYMFNYNGELHGLRNRDNMKHWTVHQDEFFDHYLLGKPKPDWMAKGVPYLERGTRDVSSLFKRATPPPAGGK